MEGPSAAGENTAIAKLKQIAKLSTVPCDHCLRGTHFSDVELIFCLHCNLLQCRYPRRFNHEMFTDCPLAKIGSIEYFRLYIR